VRGGKRNINQYPGQRHTSQTVEIHQAGDIELFRSQFDTNRLTSFLNLTFYLYSNTNLDK